MIEGWDVEEVFGFTSEECEECGELTRPIMQRHVMEMDGSETYVYCKGCLA